ncbi:hypothetical protein ABZ328_28945 [Micromonospora aurantiaca]|uniref:hypothetical protein n=1 Tax=Micromonospora aurantiaca (nom. illeg.) TaxID=47850 RepID=UPI0033D9EA94
MREVVWRELIRRARRDGPAWVITAVALAPPALRRYAGRLHTGWAGDAHDLDAEILTGFLTALRDRVNLGPPGAVRGADAGGGLTAGRPRRPSRRETDLLVGSATAYDEPTLPTRDDRPRCGKVVALTVGSPVGNLTDLTVTPIGRRSAAAALPRRRPQRSAPKRHERQTGPLTTAVRHR